MNRDQLIEKLQAIPENLEVAFKVDEDIFCDDCRWFLAENVYDVKISYLFYYFDRIYDDVIDFREAFDDDSCDDRTDDEIEKEFTERLKTGERKIIISIDA